MTTLEIRAALRLTEGDVVAAAELLASGSRKRLALKLAGLDQENRQVIEKRDAVRAARAERERARRILDDDEGERKPWTAADYVALLSSSSDDDVTLERDDDLLERARRETPQRSQLGTVVLGDRGRAGRPKKDVPLDDFPLERDDALLARLIRENPPRSEGDIVVLGDTPQRPEGDLISDNEVPARRVWADAILPYDFLQELRPFVEFNERQVRYRPETHFAYFSDFEPYRGPPPFDSRNSRYEFLRGSTWVDDDGWSDHTGKLLSLKADASDKLFGEFEYQKPGRPSQIVQLRLGRKFGILSTAGMIPDEYRERFNFNKALTMECANAVAKQIPEVGFVENGTVARFPVNMKVMTTPSTRLRGVWFDPDEPSASHSFEFELRGDTVRPEFSGERLAHSVLRNIKRVLQHCNAKQRPMRRITQGLRFPNDDGTPIADRVPPLTSAEITDDDYLLPLIFWQSPSKRAFRKSLLGHVDLKILERLQEHQFASFDDLEGLPLTEAMNIFWIYGRGFFIRTPPTQRQRGDRFTRIKSVAVRTAHADAAYIVAPKYPIKTIGKSDTWSTFTKDKIGGIIPFVIDTPLPDGSFFAHGEARMVDENEFMTYQTEGDPISWDIDEVVERIE
jgi:hypothetical protein